MKALIITLAAVFTLSLSANANQRNRQHNPNRDATYGKVRLGAMAIHEDTERNVIKLTKCGRRKAKKKLAI